MSNKIVATFKWVRVVKDNDWDEYQVEPRFETCPFRREAETYHTGDMEDAMDTARAMDATYNGDYA
jgi:hypothetical protein